MSEFYGHAMFIGNSHARKEQDVYLLRSDTVPSFKLTRFKIAPGSLMTFSDEFFTVEIERQSRYNVVEIEVSFLSKGRATCE